MENGNDQRGAARDVASNEWMIIFAAQYLVEFVVCEVVESIIDHMEAPGHGDDDQNGGNLGEFCGSDHGRADQWNKQCKRKAREIDMLLEQCKRRHGREFSFSGQGG